VYLHPRIDSVRGFQSYERFLFDEFLLYGLFEVTVHNARFLQSEDKHFESFKRTNLPRAKAAVLAIEKCPDKR
jgi:hypothetical protein